ncbi:MAG: hypothetical protein WCI27_03875, partial [Candidatus Omnitrophota bacterium]
MPLRPDFSIRKEGVNFKGFLEGSVIEGHTQALTRIRHLGQINRPSPSMGKIESGILIITCLLANYSPLLEVVVLRLMPH